MTSTISSIKSTSFCLAVRVGEARATTSQLSSAVRQGERVEGGEVVSRAAPLAGQE